MRPVIAARAAQVKMNRIAQIGDVNRRWVRREVAVRHPCLP
jgi:hypothetical protein